MAKINDYFLKAIFSENEIKQEENSITGAVNLMAKFVVPSLLQNENDDFNLYYCVPFDKLKESDIDETQAFELKQYGWILDESGANIIKKL